MHSSTEAIPMKMTQTLSEYQLRVVEEVLNIYRNLNSGQQQTPGAPAPTVKDVLEAVVSGNYIRSNGESSIEPKKPRSSQLEYEEEFTGHIIQPFDSKETENIEKLFNQSRPIARTGPLPTETQNDGKFVYKATSSGDAWSMGLGLVDATYPNAIATSKCPDEIIIPGKIKYQGVDYPVAEISRAAFYSCGLDHGSTKTIFLPKEVKIIGIYGFARLNTVINFTIEAGSQLHTIEIGGLSRIGWDVSRPSYGEDTDSDFNPDLPSVMLKTFVIPETVSTILDEAIRWCDLFTRVVYCGTHKITTPIDLEVKSPLTRVYVLPEYIEKNGKKLFNYTLSETLSDQQLAKLCPNFIPRRTVSASPSCSSSPSSSRSLSSSPSPSIKIIVRSCPQERRKSPLWTLTVGFLSSQNGIGEFLRVLIDIRPIMS